jgi:hypothetical protein
VRHALERLLRRVPPRSRKTKVARCT